MKSAFNAKVASTEFSVKLVENALLRLQRLNVATRSNHSNPRTNSERHLSRHCSSEQFSSGHPNRHSSKRPVSFPTNPLFNRLLSKPFVAIQQLKHPFTSSIRSLTTMDLNNNKENFARILWRAADCVCFDVDSTVCRDEAIDELAQFAGKEKQVQEL